MMINCPHCPHAVYWHQQRRPDEPSEFMPGLCLCGCDYLVITSYRWHSEREV